MKMTIGHFLFRRLREIGVSHIFGVPGDFNLQLLEQLSEIDGIDFVGTCNELNASYAADGYARANGIGAMLTTYGVGDLSAICGLAGACAEHVPVVLISGTPPLYAMESRLRVHHSLAEGNFDNINNCLKQFTANTVRLTPMNVADELDRVLTSCWRDKLPVTIQVPSNISYLEVEVPDAPLVLSMPPSDSERLASAVARIKTLIERAQHPLLLIDADADRCGLADDLYALAVKRRIPYVAFRTGKAFCQNRILSISACTTAKPPRRKWPLRSGAPIVSSPQRHALSNQAPWQRRETILSPRRSTFAMSTSPSRATFTKASLRVSSWSR